MTFLFSLFLNIFCAGFPSNNVQVVHVDVHHPAEPFLQVQLQDAAADLELEPVQLLQDITAIQDMAGPALEAQSTLSKSRKPDKQKKKKNHSHCGDKRQRNSSENSELFDEYLRSEITKNIAIKEMVQLKKRKLELEINLLEARPTEMFWSILNRLFSVCHLCQDKQKITAKLVNLILILGVY